ncbi:MAG: hypothetical protein KDD66_13605 [Bdellovibrionales bacterium]|nr:hypothetical protein [Bdellovibrionales bacterium]
MQYRFVSRFSTRTKNCQGMTLLMFLFSSVAFLGFASLVIDIGQQTLIRRQLQLAADGAAHAGALELGSAAHFMDIVPTAVEEALKAHTVSQASGASIWDAVQAGDLTLRVKIGRYIRPSAAAVGFFTPGAFNFIQTKYDSSLLPGDPLATPGPVFSSAHGVPYFIWVNAVKVEITHNSILALFGSVFSALTDGSQKSLSTQVASVAILDAPEIECVAPLVLPLCGILDHNGQYNPAGSAAMGLNPQAVVPNQEIIFGPIPPIEFPSTELGSSVWNPPINGVENRYPLRGGFGIPADFAGSLISDDIIAVVKSSWGPATVPLGDGSLPKKGCTKAQLGDKVKLLSGSNYFSPQLQLGGAGGPPSDAADMNKAVMNLIHQPSPAFFHHPRYGANDYDGEDHFPNSSIPILEGIHPSVPRSTCSNPKLPDSAFQCPDSLKPYDGWGGCHTGEDMDPDLVGEPVIDKGPSGVSNSGVWKTKVMLVAPMDPNTDYCDGSANFDGVEDALVVGFMSVFIFDAQFWQPSGCRWRIADCIRHTHYNTCYDLDTGEPYTCVSYTYEDKDVTAPTGLSCRGMRAKASTMNAWIANSCFVGQDRPSLVR